MPAGVRKKPCRSLTERKSSVTTWDWRIGEESSAPCDAAEPAGIIQDAQPAKDKRRPCTGLLAHVLVEKFADHLPRYRQSAIYAREGVDLEPRQPSCTRPIYGRH